MNSSKHNITSNLRFLRDKNWLTQEEVAEKIGVARQAVAKGENGGTLPDILNCEISLILRLRMLPEGNPAGIEANVAYYGFALMILHDLQCHLFDPLFQKWL